MAENRRRGEVIRLEHAISLMRAQLDSLTRALALPGPLGADVAQGILVMASTLAMGIAKHDAFLLVEEDAK